MLIYIFKFYSKLSCYTVQLAANGAAALRSGGGGINLQSYHCASPPPAIAQNCLMCAVREAISNSAAAPLGASGRQRSGQQSERQNIRSKKLK